MIVFCCSSYPHGGYTSAGLFLTCAGALSLTTYAVASCKIMVVTFTSFMGDFEETFSDFSDRQGNTVVRYKVGVGLFQWLHPLESIENGGDWSDGYCVGYQSTMLDALSDTSFETARGFAVFAVLLAFGVTIWSMLTACITWNRIQLILLSACLLSGAICTGLTFILKKASVCQSAFIDQECTIDSGGLILIAAVILWLAAFFISVIFLKPDETDDDDDNMMNLYPAPIVRQRQERQKASSYSSTGKGKSKTKTKTAAAAATLSSSRQPPPTTPATQGSFDYSYDSRESWTSPTTRQNTTQRQSLTVDDVSQQEQLEVYMASQMDRIEDAMDDDASYTGSIRMEI
jgi:hypothetical protein